MTDPRPAATRVLSSLLPALLLAVACASPPSDPLTRERLAEARALWEASGTDTYELELDIRGAINERRTVEVEAGIVIDMTAGDAPAARSAWDAWSVEGLLTLLERELANAANAKETYGIEDPDAIVLEARFDPDLGYPVHFRREVPGMGQPIEWKVVGFERR